MADSLRTGLSRDVAGDLSFARTITRSGVDPDRDVTVQDRSSSLVSVDSVNQVAGPGSGSASAGLD